MASKPPKFHAGPKFGKSSKTYGGRSAEATIGTAALKTGQAAKGSACTIVDDFNANQDVRSYVDLGVIKKKLKNKTILTKLAAVKTADKLLDLLGMKDLFLLADYSELNVQRYVRGHLLAQDLGGPGDAQNLTPLTRSCNAQHAAFEKKVIAYLKSARKTEKSGSHWVLVEYKVVAKGSMKPWFPATESTTKKLARLPNKLVCSARSAFLDKKTNAVVTAPPAGYTALNISRPIDL